MGAWGISIFSDDFACDIRGEYNAMLMLGKTDEEASKAIFDQFYEQIKNSEDEPVFWFALALSQWKKGRMMDDIKTKALEFIDNGKDLERWNTPENQKNYKNRIKELQKLKEKLLSPMPPLKKVGKPKVTNSPWKVGDLLAYKIISNSIMNLEFLNQYVLLRVIKIIQQPVSNYGEVKIYNETVLLGLYKWSGSKVPGKNIVDTLNFTTICDYDDPFLGRRLETCMLLFWSEKELKDREIVVLDNDNSYENKLPDFFDIRFNEYSWYNFNVLDNQISITLKRMNNLKP